MYATVDDMLLGDLEIVSTQNLSAYLSRASTDVDVALDTVYVTPIVTTDTTALSVLRSITADLASAYFIMANAQGGEDNRVNAYGMHLYNRAQALLLLYTNGERSLTGVERRVPLGASTTPPVSIFHEDSQSAVQAFYLYVQGQPTVTPSYSADLTGGYYPW